MSNYSEALANEILIAERDAYKSQRDELLAAAKALMQYMAEGFLVRNTKDDHKSDWALKALYFVTDMKKLHAAIASAEEHGA